MWVRTHPLTLLHDHTTSTHIHEWDQLTYAASGVMRVHTDAASWVVPPHRAVWVPAGTKHSEEMHAPVSVRTLYLVPGIAKALPGECRIVNISRLLRELILHISHIGALDRRKQTHAHLICVLLDELVSVAEVPLQLPMPRDPRAVRFAAILRQRPDDRGSVASLSRRVGASRRTMERLFLAETKMTAGELATAPPVAARRAASGDRRIRDQRRPRCGLLEHQRIHCGLQEGLRHHPEPIFFARWVCAAYSRRTTPYSANASDCPVSPTGSRPSEARSVFICSAPEGSGQIEETHFDDDPELPATELDRLTGAFERRCLEPFDVERDPVRGEPARGTESVYCRHRNSQRGAILRVGIASVEAAEPFLTGCEEGGVARHVTDSLIERLRCDLPNHST